MSTLATWILSVLVGVAPPKVHAPQTGGDETETSMLARYQKIAEDHETVINASPHIFDTARWDYDTAALMLAIEWFESGFNKKVDDGRKRGDGGRSWCLMQVNLGEDLSTHVYFGDATMKSWTAKDLVTDRKKCLRVGIEALRISFNKCSKMTGADKLSAYVARGCYPGVPEAKHRWDFMQQILKKYPYPSLVKD
jgi:hypothetical protein